MTQSHRPSPAPIPPPGGDPEAAVGTRLDAQLDAKLGWRLRAALPPVEPDARLRASFLEQYDAAEADGALVRDFSSHDFEAPRGWRTVGVAVAAAAAVLITVGTFWVSSSATAGHVAPAGSQRAVVVVDDPSLLDPQPPGADDLARLDPISPSERWATPPADSSSLPGSATGPRR